MQKRQAGLAFIMVTVFLDMLGLGIVFPILPKLIASFLNGDLSAAASTHLAVGSLVTLLAGYQVLLSEEAKLGEARMSFH